MNKLMVTGIIALFCSLSYAEFRIEVCTIPLSEIVIPEARQLIAPFKLRHMFVRGIDGSQIIGLNFEPKDWATFMDGEARIGRQTYSDLSATCVDIFSTSDREEFRNRWDIIVDAYEEMANNRRYSIIKNNCQSVTKEILGILGYVIPNSINECLQSQCSIQ